MSWRSCPVCEVRNPPSVARCTSCGADFDDPDVRAMAAAGADAAEPPALGEVGALASDKFLGVSIDSLAAGPALSRLALFGALLLGASFLIPVSENFRDLHAAWNALDKGPTFALLYPALAALLGLALWLTPRAGVLVRGALLSVLGVAGLLFCLPPLGALAAAPEKTLPLLSFGLMVAGGGLVLRVADPRAQAPRYAVAAGAALAVLGLLIPVADPAGVLPVELRFYLEAAPDGSRSPLGMVAEVFNRDPVVFFTSAYLLLPLVLLPAAALIAWPKPGGPWDKSGLLVRPIAWLVVLYVPLGLCLYLFNLLGPGADGLVSVSGKISRLEDFTRTAMLGRARLAGLATGFALWAQLGAVAAYRHLRPGR